MDSKFDYSKSCWEQIRSNFDHRYGFPAFEKTTEMKYAKYLDNDMNEHIVSLYNSNRFDKSVYNKDLDDLHVSLNKLKLNEKSQIHIVCTDYICSYSHRGFYHRKVQPGIKYYYLTSNFFEEEIHPIDEITNLLQNYTDYSKKRKSRYSSSDNDPYSERNIMRDLMNGDGDKHGF